MKRLWVQLGLMLSAVLFFVFFMQFLMITLEQTGLRADLDGPLDVNPAEIQRRLLMFMFFSLGVGSAGGFLIGRVVSAPIERMRAAAAKIGQGDLNARVIPQGSLELMELAQTFNKMADDLQRAAALRTNLMADVSHELRSPLTALEGNLRAALDGVLTLDERCIANLYAQTRYLSRLVNDLRELSLAEAGQLPVEKHAVNLHRFVEEILQALEPLAAEKDIRLRNQLPDSFPAQADSLRIRQVFFNLLINALRHTPSGGVITLTGEQHNDSCVVSVQDTGEGLTPEALQSVFTRFYRADKSRSRETGGSGLGLAIVKAIVEAHGGRVEAHSPGIGQGSTFNVWLPQHNPADHASPAGRAGN